MAVSSWFGSRQQGSYQAGLSTEGTASQKQKNKQIESLREHLTNVTEIKRDELYQLSIQVQDKTLTLTIALPPRFPLTGPVVTVSPPVRHPWVNEQMIVDGSPLVKNFNVHSSLGRSILQIVKEFNDHPPEFLPSSPPYPAPNSTPPYPVSGTSSTDGANGGYTPYLFNSAPQIPSRVGGVTGSPGVRPRRPAPPLPTQPVKYDPPPLPESFEEVKNMSTEDLQKYLAEGEGTVLVDEFVSQLEVIKKVQVDRDNTFQDNETLASMNMTHKPELEEGWTKLQEKFLELEALKSDRKKKLEEQVKLTEKYQLNSVTTRLKTILQETETESEIIAEDFLDDKMTVNEFLQKYKQARKMYHLRKSKHEKMTHRH